MSFASFVPRGSLFYRARYLGPAASGPRSPGKDASDQPEEVLPVPGGVDKLGRYGFGDVEERTGEVSERGALALDEREGIRARLADEADHPTTAPEDLDRCVLLDGRVDVAPPFVGG